MATECWLGLLMGSDGSSTLWEGAGVSPTLVVGALAPKSQGELAANGGEIGAGNIENICM